MIESFFGRLKEEWGTIFAQAETESEVKELINRAMSRRGGEFFSRC
ncbi:MAG: hypothetical protein M1309_00500 [Actinobacteria bacterium]|nr:hypothetical protein [Actinomycetota bacterium]